MKGALALRKPVGTAAMLDTSSTSVTSSAYVTLQAATAANCNSIQISNSGAQPILLATGSAGNEVNTGIVIAPSSGGQWLIPIEIAKGVRLSLKSMNATQSSGIVSIGFFQ